MSVETARPETENPDVQLPLPPEQLAEAKAFGAKVDSGVFLKKLREWSDNYREKEKIYPYPDWATAMGHLKQRGGVIITSLGYLGLSATVGLIRSSSAEELAAIIKEGTSSPLGIRRAVLLKYIFEPEIPFEAKPSVSN